MFSDEDEDEQNIYKPRSWQEIISERPSFRKKLRREINRDFNQAPREFRGYEEDVAPKLKKRRELQKQKEEGLMKFEL